jgi:CheY-like chemotaxis protein
MDGPTTFQKLKTLPETSSIPVIFMTAKVQPKEIESYKALRGDRRDRQAFRSHDAGRFDQINLDQGAPYVIAVRMWGIQHARSA